MGPIDQSRAEHQIRLRCAAEAPIYQVFDIRTDIRPTVAEVDLAALRKNADVVNAVVGPGVGVVAVVKADAYGHGAVACARALERKVWGFAVSLVEEGIELRRAGVAAPILVLGSFYGLSHRDVVAYRLTPVVSDLADLARLARAAEELSVERVALHIKIDTGMARLGVAPEALTELLDAIGQLPVLQLEGVMTHFYDADGPELGPTQAQLVRFAECLAQIRARGLRPLVHGANSAGLLRLPEARFDLVRPGLALFGHSPAHAPYAGLAPVLSLKSKVVALRDLPAGAPVSYGALFRTTRPSRVATIAIGYADGYSRRLTGSAQVLLGGRRVAVLGAITMDMCMVDVTEVACKLGDEVVVLGAQGAARVDAEELAAWSGTIVWEVFCAISKRVPRVYSGDPGAAAIHGASYG